MKRNFASVLAFLVFTSLVPYLGFAASEAFTAGDGSAENPYVITTLEQLNTVRNDLDAHYRLGADIEAMETAEWNQGDGFEPIGGDAAAAEFTGEFDGAGHVIRGLTIQRPSTDTVGLFGKIGAEGLVKQLGMEEVNILGQSYTGGIAGRIEGTIEHSYTTGSVEGRSGLIGGLAGYAGIQSKVTHSFSTAAVSGAGNYIGGLTGRSDGLISDSYATGSVSGQSYVGGLAGINEAGEIYRSYAAGDVHASQGQAGGLLGYNLNAMVSNTYAIGSVSGSSAIGGLVGMTDYGYISRSYAAGNVMPSGSSGGLIGSNNGGVTKESYWDIDTTNQTFACGFNDYGTCEANGLTTAHALRMVGYSSLDFTNDWYLLEGSTRPFLRSEWSAEIRNAHQLQLMDLDVTANYSLAQNIDFGSIFTDGSRSDMWATGGGNGLGFEPIGSQAEGRHFSGTLDGQGHTITGLYLNRNDMENTGMFSYISGNVYDLRLKDSAITGGERTGMLAGENGPEGEIKAVVASGVINGTDNTGGLVGSNQGTISDSGSDSTVNGNQLVGGLIGQNASGSVTESVYALGSVNGSTSVGGLTGSNSGEVRHAYAAASVSGSLYNIGGLIGLNDFGGQIDQSFASGSVAGLDFVGGLAGKNEMSGKVSQAYATGAVQGNIEVGGLVGRNVGAVAQAYAVGSVTGNGSFGGLVGRNLSGSISASYYNLETMGHSDGGEARMTSAMKQRPTYGSEWDFDAIWRIQEGKTYPTLREAAANLVRDAAPPTVVSATIESDHPDQVIIRFDEEVSMTNSGGIAITADGRPAAVISAAGAGTKNLVFSTDGTFNAEEQVLVSYDQQSGSISDLEGNALFSFTALSVELLPPQDQTPPVITIQMTKADGTGYLDGEWTNQAVHVNAAAFDETSSVTSLTYSLDNEVSWLPYSSELVLQEDGIHPLAFKAVDTVGNTAIEQRTVNISSSGLLLTSRLTKADGSHYDSGEWSNQSVTVSVYAKAGVSELASLTYTSAGGITEAYENEAPLVISAEGTNKLRFAAQDKAGNQLSLEFEVNIDLTPPAIRIDPNGNEAPLTSAAPKVTVSDLVSGMAASSLQYVWSPDQAIPDEGWAGFIENSSLSKSGVNGDWYLHIRAHDLAGNESIATSNRFRLSAGQRDDAGGTTGTTGSIASDTGIQPPPHTFLVGLEGRTIAFDGGEITIPAGAMDRPFYVSIIENAGSTDPDAFPLAEGELLASPWIELKKDAAGRFNKHVTFTLQFDPGRVQRDLYDLGLYQLSEDRIEPAALDNVLIDWEKGTISGTTDLLTSFAVIMRPKQVEESAVHFSDIQGHWGQKNIENLAAKGALKGYADGSFKPDRTISRAEFAAILVRALGLTATAEGSHIFDDTAGHWADKEIAAAYSLGIIQGYDRSTFAPNDAITREQIAVMLVHTLQLDTDSASSQGGEFADQAELAPWAQKAFITAVEHGLIRGYPDHTMKPKFFATRAEAITLIWRVIESRE